MKILGVDFTSAPSRRKAITVATAWLDVESQTLDVHHVDRLTDFDAFETLLATPGPWTAAFDFPFGLPRELVQTLGWPERWPELIEHVASLPKLAFKRALDSVRQARPMGSRYIARRGDAIAGASSPMKLVNPPVGLMFFEGAPRLWWAGLSIQPCSPRPDTRVALEAYPGCLARQLIAVSYKKDGPEGNTTARRNARMSMMARIVDRSRTVVPLSVQVPALLQAACVEDGSGDTLDAVLCAIQAAQSQLAFEQGDARYGLPVGADALEGWIATVPAAGDS